MMINGRNAANLELSNIDPSELVVIYHLRNFLSQHRPTTPKNNCIIRITIDKQGVAKLQYGSSKGYSLWLGIFHIF